MKIDNICGVYIHSPARKSTGGVELLHQLADILNRSGRNAWIVYHNSRGEIDEHATVIEAYEKYKCQFATFIPDEPSCVEVYPEIYFNVMRQSGRSRTRKVLWWLSVDNFYKSGLRFLHLTDLYKWSPKLAIRAVWKRFRHLFYLRNEFRHTIAMKDLFQMGEVCACQAHYIQDVLSRCGAQSLVMLSDYINSNYCTMTESESQKEDIVLYNPVKGYDFTRKIIAAAPDLKWVAIRGMTRTQTIDLMRRAKVYIDFGNHPGKDRMPRECAMLGCCIITGLKGSAGYERDMPIPKRYKYEQHKQNIPQIVSAIRFALENYLTEVKQYAEYRATIANEREEFERQARELFGCDS